MKQISLEEDRKLESQRCLEWRKTNASSLQESILVLLLLSFTSIGLLGSLSLSERPDYQGRVYETKEAIVVKPSTKLSREFDWQPVRGFDYNKDGKLDYAEMLFNGAPRIPFGSWHEIDSANIMFKGLQGEYDKTQVTSQID
jgi:hypothetical protein